MTQDQADDRHDTDAERRPKRLDALLAGAFRQDPEPAAAILARQGGDWTRMLLRSATPAASPVGDAGSADETRPELLGGRYRVDGALGRGGVGVVWKARDTTLARDVAIKVLRTRHRDGAGMAARFLEEAQIGAQLEHPGVVPVHEVGVLADHRPYFTMKLVQGRTLAELLAERGTPEQQRARFLALFERVCQTVAYAHARQVVHRDLKPANVMVGAFGEVQVVDWGMAKVLGRGTGAGGAGTPAVATVRTAAADGSVAGSVFGTPAYMAPEQARGELDAVNERSDVFALGAILCQILTGRPPFGGARDAALARAQRGDTSEALAALAACGAAPELVALACQCLAVDAATRPAHAGQVAEAVAVHLVGVEERAQAAALEAAQATARAAAERRARRAVQLLMAVLVLACAAGLWSWSLVRAGREARRHEAARAVDEAIAAGRRAWPAAGAEPESWQPVVAIARRAVGVAGLTDSDPEANARAVAFAAEVDAAAAAARALAQANAAERQLRARLEQIRGLPAFRMDWRAQDQQYAALFRELGADPMAADRTAAAAALRGHRLAAELAMALDDWDVYRRNLDPDPDTSAAIRALAQAVDPEPLRTRLRSLIQAPDAGAVREIAASVDLALLPARSLKLLSRALRTAGQAAAARSVLERGQASHPDDFWLAMHLAQETLDPTNRSESIRYSSVALALRPDSVYAGVWLGTQLAESGRHEQALAVLAALVARHADNAVLRYDLGAVLSVLGRHAEALPHLERSWALDAKSADTAQLLGRTLRALGQREAAREWLARAVSLAPQHVPALVALGSCLSDDLQQHEQALALFARAVAAEPKAADARFLRALMLDKLGQRDAALAGWRECVALDPGQVRAWEQLARHGLAMGDVAAAQDAATQALAANPRCSWAHFVLGNIRSEGGDRAGAIAAWRAAVAADPEHAHAWHNLGVELASDAATCAEGLAALRRAVALRPRSAALRAALARALFDADQLDQAEAEAREALALEAGHAEARAVLRDVGRARRR